MVLALLFASACSGGSKSCEEALYGICAEMKLPAGQTYLSGAEEGSDKYLSEDTINTLYGERAYGELFPLIEEYAIYISSFAEPYEAAVFKCRSRSDTDLIAEMCFARTDILKVILRDTEFAELVQEARVSVKGKLVFMIIGGEC